MHIINNLPVGGAERFLVQLVPAQVRLGWRAGVVTLVEPNPLAAELERRGIPYRGLGRPRLNDPRLALDLWRELRRLQPDVVHTHLFYADTFGRVAARAARVPGVVTTEHSTEGGRLSRRRRTGMHATARLAHRTVAVSEAVRRNTATRLGMPAELIRVIPNGIDLEPWDLAAALPRGELGVPEYAVVVGCVARMVESKGYDALLRAVARLQQPSLHLLMVGDGPARSRLEQEARELGLDATVHWLGFRDDVPQLLKSIDIFAMPSQWEGHSMALLEAMAAGCACLVSDIPELTETLGDACVRVRSGDVDSIAVGLTQLLTAPERRAELGRAAKRAARSFSIDVAARRYVALYDEVLAELGPG